MASVGLGSVNFMEMQQRMQYELLSNPESLRIIMENPLGKLRKSEQNVVKLTLRHRSILTENLNFRYYLCNIYINT